MRKIFCDRCHREILSEVTLVVDYELCPDCVKDIDYFINFSLKTTTMDGVRDLCKSFSKECVKCPFAVRDDKGNSRCEFELQPRKWSSEKETYSKVLRYKVEHPNIEINLRKY